MGCPYRVAPVTAAAATADHRIMVSPPVQVLLELRPDGESLSGRACRAGQPAREFTGWLGLLAVLRALLPEPPADPAPVTRKGGQA